MHEIFSCLLVLPLTRDVPLKIPQARKVERLLVLPLTISTAGREYLRSDLALWGSGACKLPRDAIAEMDFGNFISSSAREIRFGSFPLWRASPSNTNLLDMNFASVENST